MKHMSSLPHKNTITTERKTPDERLQDVMRMYLGEESFKKLMQQAKENLIGLALGGQLDHSKNLKDRHEDPS